MSLKHSLSHRAAVVLLLLAVASMGLGVWGQIQQNNLEQARADAVVIDGAGGFDAVPVPLILQPFENGQIPALLKGDQTSVFGIFARIGGALGLLGLMLFSLRTRTSPPIPVASDRDNSDDELPTMAQAQSATMAEWQRRLATRMARDMQQPATASPDASATVASRSKAQRTVYLAALSIVGAAFVTVMVSLMWGASTLSFGIPATPDMAALADDAIMGLRRAMSGDKAALFVLIQIAAAATGLLIIAKVLLSHRKSGKHLTPVKDRFATLG